MIRIIKLVDGTIGEVITGQYDETKGVELFLPVNHGGYYEDKLQQLKDLQYTEGTTEDCISFIEQEYHFGEVIKIHAIG